MLNKKDLQKLKKLLKMVEFIELKYDSLANETKEFLKNEFSNGETKMHLYSFDRNITDAIRDIENK